VADHAEGTEPGDDQGYDEDSHGCAREQAVVSLVFVALAVLIGELALNPRNAKEALQACARWKRAWSRSLTPDFVERPLQPLLSGMFTSDVLGTSLGTPRHARQSQEEGHPQLLGQETIGDPALVQPLPPARQEDEQNEEHQCQFHQRQKGQVG
jgi:hypothetical protein